MRTIRVAAPGKSKLVFEHLLLVRGKFKTPIRSIASAFNCAVPNPELACWPNDTINTTTTVTTTAPAFHRAVLDKGTMHIPPRVRTPQLEPS